MNDEIVNQLIVLNSNLSEITELLKNKSFWDSQLFAAMLGASSAVFVVIFQIFLSWRKKRSKKLREIYQWAAEQIDFHTPNDLFKEANNTSYGPVTKNKDGKIIDRTPEKQVGEKMVLELKNRVKYWNFPHSKIRKLFIKYEKSLSQFDQVNDPIDKKGYEKYFKESEKIFQQIKKLSFKMTGENEWTC